jgi:hypothetical protein
VSVRESSDAAAPGSRVPEESQIKAYKNQNNADIHHEPVPESMLKEQDIHGNDNSYHCQNV